MTHFVATRYISVVSSCYAFACKALLALLNVSQADLKYPCHCKDLNKSPLLCAGMAFSVFDLVLPVVLLCLSFLEACKHLGSRKCDTHGCHGHWSLLVLKECLLK